MLLSENLRQAFNSLLLNKKRTALTMIGIIIGLSSVLMIVSLGDTITKVVENYFIQYFMGGNTLYYLSGYDFDADEHAEGDYTVSMSEIYDFIDSTDGIIIDVESSMKANVSGTVNIDSEHKADMSLVGVSSAYEITNKLRILNGRFITVDECRNARPVAVISDIAAKACFGSCEDAIGKTINYQGEYTTPQFNKETFEETSSSPVKLSGDFVVVGVYEYVAPVGTLSFTVSEDKETDLLCPTSYCNYKLLDSSDPSDDNVGMVRFVVKDKQSVPQAKLLIENFAETKFGDDEEYRYSVLDMSEQLKSITGMISIITGAFVVIAAISLLVGGIGLMNTMLVSVTERTKEIGIKKALGARNSSIRMQFLFESAVLCLIACAIGVFFGMLFGMIIESNLDNLCSAIKNDGLKYFILNSEIHITPSMNAIVISTLFSLGVGIVFGYYPANKGAKMQPVEALRYE